MLIEHTILGNDMQAVELTLQPGQQLVAEASTLLAMDDGGWIVKSTPTHRNTRSISKK
ncbi:MAG: hypothetical protein HOO04_04600 [Phycisphaerae bacterium]|nr:hypothetical protein [Phycisphaerae bacterium]